jgi:hypothetical protein
MSKAPTSPIACAEKSMRFARTLNLHTIISGMDQTVLVASVATHLDALAKIYNWAILIAIAVLWAGLQRRPEIEVLGIKIQRQQSFYALSALFLVANLVVLVLFLRLGDILSLIDDTHILEATSRLATHSWVLNPYAFFAPSMLSRSVSAEGFGLLIVTWWLCFACLRSLVEHTRARPVQILISLFLAVGLGTMVAIERVPVILLPRLALVQHGLHEQLTSTWPERGVGILLGICVGLLLFRAALRLQPDKPGSLGAQQA